MSPGAAQKRLHFVHLLWLVLIAVAAVIGFARGVRVPLVLGSALAASLPALFGLWLLRDLERDHTVGRAVAVMSWTLLAICALVLTGAGLSPLTILFAVAPLLALNLRAPDMAGEAAIFGCIAYGAAALLGQLGVIPDFATDFAPLVTPLAFAGLMMSGLLAWFLVTSQRAVEAELLDQRQRLTAVAVSPPDPELSRLATTSRDLQRQLDETEKARAAAEQKVRDRTLFFASMGHDLRAPLNPILMSSEIMRDQVMGPMPKPYADYAGIIHQSGTELLTIVDDFLDLAKTGADRYRLEPEPINLTELAASVIRQFLLPAERAGITIQLEQQDEVWAEADPRAVTRICHNLISNAVKYSDAGGKVSVSARVDGGMAVLSVRDTGVGMSAEDMKTIMEPFTRAEATSGRKGTGLGLSLVRSFTELHGGEVKVKSKPGKGSRFDVTLPLADPADIAPLEDAAE